MKGLKDGDMVRLETEAGEVEGRIKVTETVHPEVVGIGGCFGRWAVGIPVGKGRGVHFNSLLSGSLERRDMTCSAIDACIKVKVSKIGGMNK